MTCYASLGDYVKEDEMGRACRTYEWNERCIHISWSEDLKGTDHSEILRVDGKIILEWILGKR
jgi:hypothetical protein